MSAFRRYAGLVTWLLSWIGLLICVTQTAVAVIPPTGTIPPRIAVALVISLALLVLGLVLLRSAALIWQVLLQAVAVGSLVVGARVLVEVAFRSPRMLLSNTGIGAGVALLFGAAAAILVRRLQKRFIPK